MLGVVGDGIYDVEVTTTTGDGLDGVEITSGVGLSVANDETTEIESVGGLDFGVGFKNDNAGGVFVNDGLETGAELETVTEVETTDGELTINDDWITTIELDGNEVTEALSTITKVVDGSVTTLTPVGTDDEWTITGLDGNDDAGGIEIVAVLATELTTTDGETTATIELDLIDGTDV
jgi:hypothetical protein